MANGHGGSRPGAGRKPKPHYDAETTTLAEEKIAQALPDIVDKLIRRALTCNDMQAARYLCDRALGRVPARPVPTETKEDETTGDTLVDHILARLEQNA